MQPYTNDEKELMRVIAEKASATDSVFQKVISEHFFKREFRPFMLIDHKNQRVILFFSQSKKFEEFFRLMNLIALLEDLEEDRLIIRLPLKQDSYFIGVLHDTVEEKDENGKVTYFSPSSGKYMTQSDLCSLHSRWGEVSETLDPVSFDDPATFSRLQRAFSGLVYPREALRNLVRNEFRFLDQRRHRQIMFATWTAIALSLIFSSLSLYLSLGK